MFLFQPAARSLVVHYTKARFIRSFLMPDMVDCAAFRLPRSAESQMETEDVQRDTLPLSRLAGCCAYGLLSQRGRQQDLPSRLYCFRGVVVAVLRNYVTVRTGVRKKCHRRNQRGRSRFGGNLVQSWYSSVRDLIAKALSSHFWPSRNRRDALSYQKGIQRYRAPYSVHLSDTDKLYLT